MSLLLLFGDLTYGAAQHAAYVLVKASRKTFVCARVNMGPFNAGDVVDIDFDFLDSHTNELIDPTTEPLVRVSCVSRDGTRRPTQTFTYGTDVNVIQLAPGRYRASIDVDEAGTWQFSIVSPGPYAKASEAGYFEVAPVLGP